MKDLRFTKFLYTYRRSNPQKGIPAKTYSFCPGCIGMFMREAVFEMYNDPPPSQPPLHPMQNKRICYELKKKIKSEIIRAIRYSVVTPSLEAICGLIESGCSCVSCNPKADE